MSLKGAVAFVAGGTGIVGTGAVSSLLMNGAKCWVAARDESRFETLIKSVPAHLQSNLNLVKADLSNEKEAMAVRDKIIQKDGQLNHVVASIGGWRTEGNLSTVPVNTYEQALKDMTLPHFVTYRTFAKMLAEKPNSTYTFVTGGSADVKIFDPKASMLPPSAGLMYGMYTAACSEYRTNKNLKLIQLRVYFWVRRDPDYKFDPKKSQMEAGSDYVAKFLPKIILKNKTEIYKLPTRSIADKLYETL